MATFTAYVCPVKRTLSKPPQSFTQWTLRLPQSQPLLPKGMLGSAALHTLPPLELLSSEEQQHLSWTGDRFLIAANESVEYSYL